MIPYGRQDVTDDDISAVVDALRSDFLTQGPLVPRFEAAISTYCGSEHAVAVNSATSALHIACLALELRPGDWLWTSPITFVASANCALYCGASVDFVDIDPLSLNICPDALEEKLRKAARVNRLPKIVVAVHFGGSSCDMASLSRLSKQYGFSIVEDASHAIGGRYHDEPIGRCIYSDITVFSFHPVKIITSAEGGMAVTNDNALAGRMRLFRSHGVIREPVDLGLDQGAWVYNQVALGYNYRLTDLHAALGLSQANRIDQYVRRRNELARTYGDCIKEMGLEAQTIINPGLSAYHLYVVRVPADDRLRIFDHMRNANIGVNVHYIPVHTQPFYRKLGFTDGDFPESEKYYAQALTLPLFPTMTSTEQDYVLSTLQSALR